MRVTRAALRANKPIHEDPEEALSDQVPMPSTPVSVLRDITFEKTNSAPIPPKTPKFDPELHKEPVEKQEVADERQDAKEDSFIESITSRSPAKSLHRIEDSVEAIDALEEAIERVSDDLPVIKEIEVQSPLKAQKSTPKPRVSTLKVSNVAKSRSPPNKKLAERGTSTLDKHSRPQATNQAQASAHTPRPLKPTINRPSTVPSIHHSMSNSKTVARPTPAKVLTSNPRGELSVSKSPTKTLTDPPQKPKARSTLSTSKPGFVTIKSVKAPTTATFTLPGEAVAAKLKAQREERKKREEAEENKKEFKAKPAPSRSVNANAPRETKTSRARLSMMNTSNKENIAPKVVSAEPNAKRNLTVAKTRAVPPKANSAARRVTSVPTISPSTLAGNGIDDAMQQKARAKKAREEAAEKGRAASREWAERQKRKLALEAAGKTENVGQRSMDVVMA